MDPEPQPSTHTKQKTYSAGWENFVDRAMQILVERPTDARYTIKYVPKNNRFVLKVTDGQAIVMKKANANTEFEEIQKFTYLATRALTNESEQKKAEKQLEKPKKKKNKKKDKN